MHPISLDSFSPGEVFQIDPSEEASKPVRSHHPVVLASLIETSNRVVASNSVVNWHVASYDEFWLITEGTATIGHAGRLISSEAGTLFLSRRGETHGAWNRSGAVRLWVLKFRTSAAGRLEFSKLMELTPAERIFKLSAAQQHLFCDIFLKIAFEKSRGGCLNITAIAAWLTIQLVNVMRWTDARRDHPVAGGEELDLRCFELWQNIHRHARQVTSAEPMMLSKDPTYDSLRHRFQKCFGVSPRGLLVRLRMDRAKELLRTSNLSIKEIAQELGYSQQHEFTRAFSRFAGKSPSEWKYAADRS
jgi:mannose-6-phosphate isomerase-like protein (cupin superfamily)